MSDSYNNVVIETKKLSKIYPDGVIALRDVNFKVYKGEIHGVLGENGAGKTTLMRILYGEIKPSKGIIKIFGKNVNFKGPWDAIRTGIFMVYQHFSLIPSFTVLENLVLTSLSMGEKSWDRVSKKAEKIMKTTGLSVPLDEKVEDLPIGLQQRVEILKALLMNAKILILDEPTSILTPIETKQLFSSLKELKKAGITVIFITHKLKEAISITDKITVMRKGIIVGTIETRKATIEKLAKMMVEKDIKVNAKRDRKTSKEVILSVRNLEIKDENNVLKVKSVSFDLKRGEILGIAGVQGNGQKELIEAIVGLKKVERGKIYLGKLNITNKPTSEIYSLGISYVPDSRCIGLVQEMNLIENSSLTHMKTVSKNGFIMWRMAIKLTKNIVYRYNVITKSLKTKVKYLSGGNQQRLMIGREVLRKPKVIIVAEPTHGLDLAATKFIREQLVKLRDEGKGVLLVSSDLDEILQLSDRIAVMFDGKIVALKKADEISLEEIGMLMGGAY